MGKYKSYIGKRLNPDHPEIDDIFESNDEFTVVCFIQTRNLNNEQALDKGTLVLGSGGCCGGGLPVVVRVDIDTDKDYNILSVETSANAEFPLGFGRPISLDVNEHDETEIFVLLDKLTAQTK